MLSFFPLDVLDEVWDVIESVSGGFFIYSYTSLAVNEFSVFFLSPVTDNCPSKTSGMSLHLS